MVDSAEDLVAVGGWDKVDGFEVACVLRSIDAAEEDGASVCAWAVLEAGREACMQFTYERRSGILSTVYC